MKKLKQSKIMFEFIFLEQSQISSFMVLREYLYNRISKKKLITFIENIINKNTPLVVKVRRRKISCFQANQYIQE
jgi:hypothetical protein